MRILQRGHIVWGIYAVDTIEKIYIYRYLSIYIYIYIYLFIYLFSYKLNYISDHAILELKARG